MTSAAGRPRTRCPDSPPAGGRRRAPARADAGGAAACGHHARRPAAEPHPRARAHDRLGVPRDLRAAAVPLGLPAGRVRVPHDRRGDQRGGGHAPARWTHGRRHPAPSPSPSAGCRSRRRPTAARTTCGSGTAPPATPWRCAGGTPAWSAASPTPTFPRCPACWPVTRRRAPRAPSPRTASAAPSSASSLPRG